FQVTMTDAAQLTATSSVSVTVVQTLTSISVTPASSTVAPGSRVQLYAQALDQFGIALAVQPTFTWRVVSGPGKVSRTGLFTASTRRGVTAVIQASSGGVSGRATVTTRSTLAAAHAAVSPSPDPWSV